MAWFRLHEGAYCDAKWPVIARKSRTNVGTVVAIWVAMLDHASQNEVRGNLEGFDPETIDALYGYRAGTCQMVMDAMIEKGLIADACLVNWEKRQPNKEDDGNAERQRRYKENKRQMEHSNKNAVTQGNAAVTPDNAAVTPDNAAVTQGNAADKIREDKNKNIKNPPTPQRGAGEVVDNPKNSSRPKSGNTLPELRGARRAYTQSEKLLAALEDFRLMRERIKKPMTGRALQLVLEKLDELGGNDEGLKVAMLEQSILNSWQGIFALKESARASPAASESDAKLSKVDLVAKKSWENYLRTKPQEGVA